MPDQETKHKWKMPKHLEKYRELINNTGGNSIEKLMNHKPTAGLDPLAVLGACVSSQVFLLNKMHKEGLLK